MLRHHCMFAEEAVALEALLLLAESLQPLADADLEKETDLEHLSVGCGEGTRKLKHFCNVFFAALMHPPNKYCSFQIFEEGIRSMGDELIELREQSSFAAGSVLAVSDDWEEDFIMFIFRAERKILLDG